MGILDAPGFSRAESYERFLLSRRPLWTAVLGDPIDADGFGFFPTFCALTHESGRGGLRLSSEHLPTFDALVAAG